MLPRINRHAVRIDDYKYRFIEQPNGWLGAKEHVDAPSITNLRLDPFERLGTPANGTLDGSDSQMATVTRQVSVPLRRDQGSLPKCVALATSSRRHLLSARPGLST